MKTISEKIKTESAAHRRQFIVKSFTDNYAELIAGDANAWRGKFRKMSETPFAFFRGSAGLFYADVSRDPDPFLDEQTSRVWIQGDLHAENFGTYMNGAGVLVFDVNDYDESYVAPFTWDVKRFCASLALIGYQKAMSDAEIRQMITVAAQSYARQVARFAANEDKNFSLTLANTKGSVLRVLQEARQLTRIGLLGFDTEIKDGDRRFKINKNCIAIDAAERAKIEAALLEYYTTIPKRKQRAKITYNVKDVVRRRGLGIGSAGLRMYSVLLEGETEALENDIIISLKIAQPSAAAKYVKDAAAASYFIHQGQRTAISQRALQTNADPFLGYTTIDGQGVFATEVSPYGADLDWSDINDLDDTLQVIEELGRCVAKIHCCSDDDSDQTLIQYSIEDAINKALDGREAEFVDYMVDFGDSYAAVVRNDHRLFVDAFRNHEIPGL